MTDRERVAAHYARERLVEAIARGLAALGLSPETATVEALATVDEFHIGGRAATEALFDRLAPTRADRALDIGCGLGGAARLAAARFGCRVTGIDLTAAYVDAGNTLTGWVGLTDRVDLRQGDATDLPFPDASFDVAWMLHVGMNVADKVALARSLYRALRPGGQLGIYDIMRGGNGDPPFPLPWAGDMAASALATPAAYRAALEQAGFGIVSEENRRDFALGFFDRARAENAARGGPPPLGLHILMGKDAGAKYGNMIQAVKDGLIAPVEIVARKPD